MNTTTLIFNSLRHYWRTHLGVFGGTVLSTAILVGALIVGDSVRCSLQHITLSRLGNTEFAMDTGDRFFRVELAKKMQTDLAVSVAPVLQLQGIAIKDGGAIRANQIVVNGVDKRFREVGGLETPIIMGSSEVVINERLAMKLELTENDEFLLKVEKPDVLPRDTPLAPKDIATVSFRLKIKKIIRATEFGSFSLRSNQVPPLSVFLPIDLLAQKMELAHRANILLVAQSLHKSNSIEKVISSLNKNWTLADAGLTIKKPASGNSVELTSDRIFLEEPILAAAERTKQPFSTIFTYFVNTFIAQNRRTPYSFVSAPGAPIVPPAMNDDEIMINDWLAQDLGVRIGDQLEITYDVLLSMRQLEERTAAFRIKQIVPLKAPYTDVDLMPAFPGLADAGSCREWEPGIPINLDLIRDKDEKYWEIHRGTPKAFITLSKAQQLWGNRFGDATAIRFENAEPETIAIAINKNLNPAALGFQIRPVREAGLKAGTEAVDFGQLFIGLSFFIIIAALLLTALLFILGIEQRTNETGVLLAIGFPFKQVKRLLLAEGAFIAVIAGIMGALAAVFYNEIVLYALGTVWKGATGTSNLQLHLKWPTLLLGCLASILMAIGAMWLAIRKQARHTIAELQQPGLPVTLHLSSKWKKINHAVILLSVLLVLAILIFMNPKAGQSVAGAFFGAGGLLLPGGLALAGLVIGQLGTRQSARKLSLPQLGIRNSSRRAGRSLAVIGLLATGIFLVVSVGANRFDPTAGTGRRSSGTGGFAFWGETVLPVVKNLNDSPEQQKLGIHDLSGVQFVPFRVQAGDDASCLNLNRVQQPQLLGVRSEELADRAAFSFAAIAENISGENPWLALNRKFDKNVIPAIADQTVILWGLGKAVGDTLNYLNETGEDLKLVLIAGLANSVFQGNVLISEENLIAQYPSNSGYRIFLIDCPPENRAAVSQSLNRRMQDYGLDLNLAAVRLAEFNVVTETYLRIFLALGGLGLLLGSIGLGIVVFRNTLERRGELALLRAIGYSKNAVQQLMLAEHVFLLVGGILLGALSAALSILPAIFSSGNTVPYKSLIILLAILALWGILWIWFSAKFAMRGALLDALRHE